MTKPPSDPPGPGGLVFFGHFSGENFFPLLFLKVWMVLQAHLKTRYYTWGLVFDVASETPSGLVKDQTFSGFLLPSPIQWVIYLSVRLREKGDWSESSEKFSYVSSLLMIKGEMRTVVSVKVTVREVVRKKCPIYGQPDRKGWPPPAPPLLRSAKFLNKSRSLIMNVY